MTTQYLVESYLRNRAKCNPARGAFPVVEWRMGATLSQSVSGLSSSRVERMARDAPRSGLCGDDAPSAPARSPADPTSRHGSNSLDGRPP